MSTSPTGVVEPPAPVAGRALSDMERWLGMLLLIAALVGLGAAFELAFEKFRMLENPLYVPACSLGESVDCASVMRSSQSEAFGFPNPFLGLGGFGGLAASALILVSGGRFGRWFWLVMQAGLSLAVVFVHWLMFQTLYRIGAVCPYCMAVWVATITAFWYVTLRNARPWADRPGPAGAAITAATRNHGIVITAWLLLIAALVIERFWAPWNSVFV